MSEIIETTTGNGRSLKYELGKIALTTAVGLVVERVVSTGYDKLVGSRKKTPEVEFQEG